MLRCAFSCDDIEAIVQAEKDHSENVDYKIMEKRRLRLQSKVDACARKEVEDAQAVLNSDLKLMFLKPEDKKTLICVNPDDRKVIFKTEAYYQYRMHNYNLKISDFGFS